MTDMPGLVHIQDVIATSELDRRPSRNADYEGESRALSNLAQTLADWPDQVLQQLAEQVMSLTRSESAGISLLEPGRKPAIFRWVAIAGAFKGNLGGTLPQAASPCGEVIRRDEVVLFRQPEHYFPELRASKPQIHEGLLAPFRLNGIPAGTVWAIKHTPDGQFDREDARLLQSLSRFASAAGSVLDANNRLRDEVATRERQQRALRGREEQLAAIFNTAPVGLFVLDLQGRFIRVNDEICRIFKRPREMLLQLSAADVTFPADLPPTMERLKLALASGKPQSLDKRYVTPSGSHVWASSTISPLHGVLGSAESILVVTVDLTARRQAEAALRESEERLRSAIDVGKLATWDWNVATNEVTWSDEHFRMEGYEVGEVKPSYEAWSSRIHPDDRALAETKLHEAMQTGRDFVHEFRSRHPDGTVRWLSSRGRFVYDEEGNPVRMIGAMTDITDRHQWEDTQKVLIAELQHRTRNLMAVVRSMTSKTLQTSGNLIDFERRFGNRLAALARVQGLLSRLNEGERVSFDTLIRTELSSVGADMFRITLCGPAEVRLRSAVVQTLALALHELVTNALKYGALSQAKGCLAITWRLESEGDHRSPWLHIDWKESGVVMPSNIPAAPGRGQGRELIERALPYQLSAATSYHLGPDGVHCTISIPLAGTVTHRDHADE